MSSSNKLDLPAFGETIFPTLMDRNFSTYKFQEQGNAQVVVEKYFIKKEKYIPYFLGDIGTVSQEHTNSVLLKEDSFRDIGGGFATFLRHFVRIPNSWFDYEQKNINYWFQSYQGTPVGINYDYGCGSQPFGFGECGFLTGYARRNLNVQTKATRYYITEQTLKSYVDNDYKLPEAGLNWSFSSLYPNALADNTFTAIAQEGTEAISIPSFLFINQPRVKLSSNATDEIALTQDSIRKWEGKLYELTRYTSQIQPTYSESIADLTFQMSYSFESDVTDSQKNDTMVNFTSDSGGNALNSSSGIFYNVADFLNPEENQQAGLFAIVSQGGLRIKSLTTTGGESTLSITNTSGFSLGTIVSTWNNTNPVVQLSVLIGNE